jgi:hypothetical protein
LSLKSSISAKPDLMSAKTLRKVMWISSKYSAWMLKSFNNIKSQKTGIITKESFSRKKKIGAM